MDLLDVLSEGGDVIQYCFVITTICITMIISTWMLMKIHITNNRSADKLPLRPP